MVVDQSNQTKTSCISPVKSTHLLESPILKMHLTIHLYGNGNLLGVYQVHTSNPIFGTCFWTIYISQSRFVLSKAVLMFLYTCITHWFSKFACVLARSVLAMSAEIRSASQVHAKISSIFHRYISRLSALEPLSLTTCVRSFKEKPK
jgi:hypothetical protein